MKPAKTILDVMHELFAGIFAGESWDAWRVLLAAVFGLPKTAAQGEFFAQYTGRDQPPDEPAREAWLVIGRRGGKSRIAALVAVFLACFRKYALALGEIAVVMLIAADRKQARIVKRYISAFLHAVPMLEKLIVTETKEAIELRNNIIIEVHAASFRTTRGYTVVAVLLDEIAFFPTDDAAEPDHEIVAALRPAMSTVSGALLLAISSPYARRGELWNAHQHHYGRNGDPVLVWKADTRTMNPRVPEHVIASAYQEDPAKASAEYGAEFRRDVEAYVSLEALQAVTIEGRTELPALSEFSYRAFCDPAGGSGTDSMTLGIAHTAADGRAVLDLVREAKPPFSPETVVEEFAKDLKRYRCFEVVGDKFGGDWPSERFQKAGVSYQASELTRSEIYQAFLPLVTSGRVELLDNQTLERQFSRLERRTTRAGRDLIDHAPQSHDDVSNAASGALVLAQGEVQITDAHFVIGTRAAAIAARDEHLIEDLGYVDLVDRQGSPWRNF